MGHAVTYLADLMKRCVALCKEAVPNVEAVPFFIYSGNPPYFTMRLGQEDLSADNADMETRKPTVIIRYVIGHLTSEYIGQPETRLYEDIPLIEDVFASCGMLQSAAFPAPMDFLMQASFGLTRGLTPFPAVGVPVSQLGTEFTLRTEFVIPVQRRY
jgi:hypothetical protein